MSAKTQRDLYAAKSEWGMGNGQCPECYGLSPKRRWGDWRKDKIGHMRGCILAGDLGDFARYSGPPICEAPECHTTSTVFISHPKRWAIVPPGQGWWVCPMHDKILFGLRDTEQIEKDRVSAMRWLKLLGIEP